MSRSYNPRTTKVRIGAPLNADLFTTIIDASAERPKIFCGETMEAFLGSAWSDHFIVSVTENPANGGSQKTISLTHFRNVPMAEQFLRNAEMTEGERLVRTYVIHQDKYPPPSPAPPTPDPYVLQDAVVGVADPKYPKFGFTHDSMMRSPFGLDSVFVMVQRIHQQIVKVRTFFDDEMERYVTETTRIIAAGTGAPSSEPGKSVEVTPVNIYFDLEVTMELQPLETDSTLDGEIIYPLVLPSLMEDKPYPFPPLTTDVTIETAWARAFNGEDESFSQDFYFKFHMVTPRRGPYEARVVRYLTPNPDSLRGLFPIHQITPTSESIGVSAWYAIAPATGQCRTFARADELHMPESIHPAITITEPDGPSIGEFTRTLAMSPGYTNFTQLGVINASYETTKTRYGLYEVSIIQINCSGVYSGSTSPFGEGNTGAGGAINTTPAPVISSAVMGADNRTVSGNATPNAVVTVSRTVGGVKSELGRGTAGATGNFILTLNTVYTDTVTLQLFARFAGKLSLPFSVETFDLTPEAPTVSIDPGLAIVSGLSEPDAVITISMIPSRQKFAITASVATPITVAGDLVVVFTSAFIPTSPITLGVFVNVGYTAIQVANAIREVFEFTPNINELFGSVVTPLSSTAASIEVTKRIASANDNTLGATIATGTASTVAAASSTTVIVGRAADTVITADAAGAFSYTFVPPLNNGDVLSVTASDAGGSSPATVLTASSAPPSTPVIDPPGSFASGSFEIIEGTTTALAEVRAYLNGVQRGIATADGAGAFTLTVDRKYIAGEVFEVVANIAGDTTIRSAAAIVTAVNLNLVRPELSLSNSNYYGQLQSAMLAVADYDDIKVIVRNEGTLVEAAPVEIYSSFQFNFNILSLFSLPAPPQAGERFEVFYRFYADGTNPATAMFDGPAFIIAFPLVPLAAVEFQLVIPQVTGLTSGTYRGTEAYNGSNWIDSNGLGTTYPGVKVYRQVASTSRSFSITPPPGGYFMQIISPNAGVGTSVEITFPGQATPPITTTDLIYNLAPIPRFPYVTASFPLFPQSLNLLVPDPSAAQYTRSEIEALIPTLIQVVVTAPDGRQSLNFFDRSTVEPFS